MVLGSNRRLTAERPLFSREPARGRWTQCHVRDPHGYTGTSVYKGLGDQGGRTQRAHSHFICLGKQGGRCVSRASRGSPLSCHLSTKKANQSNSPCIQANILTHRPGFNSVSEVQSISKVMQNKILTNILFLQMYTTLYTLENNIQNRVSPPILTLIDLELQTVFF